MRFASLPRRSRARFETRREAHPNLEFDEALPEPRPALVRVRFVAWALLLLRLWARVLLDRLRGWDAPARRGAHLRHALEQLGGPAMRLGQQLSMRADLFPFEACVELARMPDIAPAFPTIQAIARVEAAAGRPLHEVFARFDPTPFESNTVACVYRAELRGGGDVAVLVRRPGVLEALAAELRALCTLIRIGEELTLVRRGLAGRLEEELSLQIGQSLDYIRTARLHRLFTRLARKHGLSWLRACAVHEELGSAEVMITRFAPGVRAGEVSQAVRDGGPEAKRWLAEHGINPVKLGRRLLQAAWWAQFELPFFPVEIRMRSLSIQPNDRIVFVDLGDCAQIPLQARSMVREALRRLTRKDGVGATDALMNALGPFPFIDVPAFRGRLEHRVWTQFFGMQHRQAPPLTRTTTGLWLSLIETARDYGVPVSQDVLRLMRSALRAERLAAEFWPKLDLLDEFRRYVRNADRREVQRTLAELGEEQSTEALQRIRRDLRLEKLARWRFLIDRATQELPHDRMPLTAKGAYIVSTLLRFAWALGAVAVASSLLLGLAQGLSGQAVDPRVLALSTLRSPLFLAVAALAGVLALRRMRARLGDWEDA